MSDEMTTQERLAAWLDGEAALYRERAQHAEAAQDWDPAVRYAGAADALVQLRDRVLRGLAAIFGQWPGDETDEEIRHGGGEMSDTTQHTPADVREQTEEWARTTTSAAAALARHAISEAHKLERYAEEAAHVARDDVAQQRRAEAREYRRLAALLRTPRGEGEAAALAAEILAELRRAREKFPGNNVTTLALVEEVGELAKATFEETRDRVRKEAVQVAVMAMRVVLDGDQTLDAWREAKGLDPLIAARRGEGGGE